MIALALLLIAAIPIHLMWLRKRRLEDSLPIGSRWIYGSYLSFYKAEVIDHHPLSNEITIVRIRINDTFSVKSEMRVNARSFLSSAKLSKEKKGEHPQR